MLPGLGFLALVYLYVKQQQRCPPLAACHLQQTLTASLWAGFLLVVANALIILLGGYTAPSTWTLAILYFTVCHSTLVAWAVVLLTYLLPPAEIYGNLWRGDLTRNQAIFIGVGTTLFFHRLCAGPSSVLSLRLRRRPVSKPGLDGQPQRDGGRLRVRPGARLRQLLIQRAGKHP